MPSRSTAMKIAWLRTMIESTGVPTAEDAPPGAVMTKSNMPVSISLRAVWNDPAMSIAMPLSVEPRLDVVHEGDWFAARPGRAAASCARPVSVGRSVPG
jgi:hypothetical protein